MSMHLCTESKKNGDILATGSVIASPNKQQIPPLRCAPVGMTNQVDNFTDRNYSRRESTKALLSKGMMSSSFSPMPA